MPIPAGERVRCGPVPKPRGGGAAVSLPVLAASSPGHVKKSKSGPRRAAVLIGVNLLMAAHIVLWAAFGMRRTLSPVEPSEARFALDRGVVNAGLVFFVLAILSTLIFGRWFCGWACHIVSLQDLCAWVMKKAGVRPKPFRSRLLVFATVGLAFYMFCWVPLLRSVVKPALGAHWDAVAPYVGEPGVRPPFRAEFVKERFWETFPSWWVAIPFLGVCGFATVWFLGAKGYCTYGCPYGGFFGPADRLAPGRILVTDACEQCGHCTSVCTSNVRVHEEVRDFGMVVDPGCMRCLDCVSVCPNGALYYGFARPPAFSAKKAPAKRRLYDAPLVAEVGMLGVGLVVFFGFTNMFDQVPMLMATGLAAIGAFLAWKLWELARVPNVRVQNVQLKLKGRIKGAGVVAAVGTVLLIGAGAWGAAVKWSLLRADVLANRLTSSMNQLVTPGYSPSAEEKRTAGAALAWLRRASLPSRGGWGWSDTPKTGALRAYLALAAGDFAEAEGELNRVIERSGRVSAPPHRPAPDQGYALGPEMRMRGATPAEVTARYRTLAAEHPGSGEARVALAIRLAEGGDAAGAAEQAQAAVSADPTNLQTILTAAGLLGHMERSDLALGAYAQAARVDPKNAGAHAGLGLSQAGLGHWPEAEAELREAVRLEPQNPLHMRFLASLLREVGKGAEASEWEARANGLSAPGRSGR